ncbi:MAG: tetratricopeptide repeat protein [Phormidium sp.]
MSTPPGLLDLTPLFASNAELDDLTLTPPDTVVPSTHEGQQEPSKQFAMGQSNIMGPEKMTQNGDTSKEFEQPETQTQFTPLQEIEASSREEWLTLAQRLKAEERWGEAIAAYKQAVNEDRQPQTQKQSGQDSLNQEIAASPESFEQLQAQAFTYGQQRQWQACIETCEQALRLQPTASLYKLLGDVSQITGQLTQAQRSYREALRLQPDFAEVYGNLGTLYAREREWQRAIECFRRALRYQPQQAAHHRALAGVWEQVGNEVEAVRCWHQVLSLEPESGQARDYFSLGNRWVRLGEWPMAERYYREAIARDEQFTDAWHNLAEVLAHHQQWQPAREIYERILPREPQRVMSRLGYARVLTKLQDWQGAMAEYHRLAEFAPEQVLAQQRFAQTLKEQGLLEEAIAVYRRALSFAPDEFELRLGFAELLCEQEQWEEALPQAEAAIALNPEVAQAHYYAGRAQVACEHWQAAIPYLEQAVRLDSQLFWARYFWGESLLALEDWQGAAAVLEAAMPLNPEYPKGYCHLGQAFLELERYSEAVQAYRQAISFGSNYLSYSHLGVALLKLKDWDGAIEILNRGLELTPDYYKFYLLLGEAFLEKQDWQAAIEALGQAVALTPEGLEFNLQLQQLLCRLGQSQEPVKNLRQALDLNCDDPQLQLALGVVLLEGRIDLDWAEACLRQNLELQPDQPQGHFYLGKCSARQGQLDEALGFYRRSWELSQSVDCGLALGEVLQQLGRWSEAVQQYRQVLLEFGESGEALFGLGQALAASERPMEAVVEWRRAMGLGWNSPELYRCLAEALVSLERWDEAVLEWGRLLELQPGNALVRRQRALALIGLGRWSESAQEWQQYWQVAPGSGQGTVLDFRPELGMYGEIPHHQELSLTGDLTIEFWLRLRQWPQDWTNLVGKFVSDEQNEFCLRIKDGERGHWYYGRGEGCATPLTWVPQETIPLHQWVHITCVRKFGQSGQLYINGVLQGEQDWGNESGATPTEAPVRLMVSSRLHQFSDGQLSELRIWNVARTGDEIRGGMCEPLTEGEPGLVAVWSGSEDGGLVDLRGQYQGQMRQAAAAGTSHPRVGVCSCEVSQNGRKRADTLAQLYGSFAQVELISSQSTQSEEPVSQPNRETEIPCHTIQVEDDEPFLEQALGLVLAHPYEVVHLSKPGMPNVILGLLYKLLWDARVIVDIDDEELSSVEASEPLDLGVLLSSGGQLPPLLDLLGQDWTRIAVGLARAFDGLRKLDGTSVATARAEKSLAELVTEVLAVPGCELSDKWVGLLQGLPAVDSVVWELRDEGRFKQVQMNDDSDGYFAHHRLGEALEELGRFDEAVLSKKNLEELQQPVTSSPFNLTRFSNPEEQTQRLKRVEYRVDDIFSGWMFESSQFIRPLFLFSDGDSIDILARKLFLSKQITQKSVIHILKVSSGIRNFLLRNNQHLNSILVLANCAKDMADYKYEMPGVSWRTLKINSTSFLVSMSFDPGFLGDTESLVKSIKKIGLFNKKNESETEAPSLKTMIKELSNGSEYIYIKKIEKDVDSIIDNICSSAKRQRRLIGGLLDILILSKEQNLLRLKLQFYLEKSISEFEITTDKRRSEILLRKIDSCIYLLFELSEERSSDILAGIFKPAFDIMLSRHSQTVVLWRGLRHSFLKAIDLSQYLPTVIELAKNTNTYDSIAFLAIHNAMYNRSSNAKFEPLKTWLTIKNTFELPKKELISLVRDLRRTIPTSSYIPENMYQEIISELKIADKSNFDSEIILAKFMMLIYSNCFNSRLLDWLNKNYKEIGISRNEKSIILAITGSDIPFITKVNEDLIKKGFDYKILYPSNYSDLGDYMEASLTQWANNPHSDSRITQKNRQPLISVIVTTYNPDIRLLELSLKSITLQSHKNLEIIIIDDCSSCNYSKMIELIFSKIHACNICDITYKRNKKNIGQYASRNIAIEIAKGEFIAIQDDDDVSHPQRLEFQLQPMLHNSSLIASYTNHIRISKNSRLMIDGNGFSEILGDAPVSLICRKKVFDEIGLFSPTKTRGDVEFRLRMQRHYFSNAVEVIPEPLLLMRGGMNTISSCKEYYFRSALKVWREVMKNLPIKKDMYTEMEKWIPTILK